MIKKFFGINEKFRFEFFDLTCIFTLANVILILCGFWFAPIFGLINCCLFFIYNVKNHAHVNNYLTQIALVILNLYFLK